MKHRTIQNRQRNGDKLRERSWWRGVQDRQTDSERDCGGDPEKLCYKVIHKGNIKNPPCVIHVHTACIMNAAEPTFTRVYRERGPADVHTVCTMNVDWPLLRPQDPSRDYTVRRLRGDAPQLSVSGETGQLLKFCCCLTLIDWWRV